MSHFLNNLLNPSNHGSDKQKPRNLLRGLGYIELAFKLIQNMPRN